MKKKIIAAVLFISISVGVPLLNSISRNQSDAYGIAAIWSDGVQQKVFGTATAVIETGGAIALAYGAICPPQFAAVAVVGL